MTRRRAVLIDRDGTILAYRPHLTELSEVALIPHVATALRRLREAGYLLAVVTNQSVIGRGLATVESVGEIHKKMLRLLALEGASVDAIRVCPHRPDEACRCRKPLAGMVDSLAAEHGFDAREAVVVGDNETDIALAHTVGCASVLVRTGLGDEMLAKGPVACDHVAVDLDAAATWIIARDALR